MALDRVLKGGRLVDGTGAPARVADVGIRQARIAAVGASLSAPEVIDCSGLVVCPGFIDTHSHSDVKVLADPLLPMKVRQGITLEVFGQDGISVAPVRTKSARPGSRSCPASSATSGSSGTGPPCASTWPGSHGRSRHRTSPISSPTAPSASA